MGNVGSFRFLSEAEDAKDGAGEHDFFVSANDANNYLAAGRGNDGSGGRISLFVEFEAKELEAFTDAGADDGSVLADASCEDERVESAKRGGERTDPFSCLIAKHGDGFGGATVLLLAGEQ